MSTRMETTFYDDPLHAFSQHEPAGFGSYGHQHHHPRPLKHALTLDLHADPPGGLKPHPLRARAGQELLTSPDVGLLRLGSPELERLIIQSGHGLVTTTPTPTQFLCPRDVTDAQEGFAEGFVRALAELHHAHMPGGAPAAAAVSALPPPSDPAPPAGSGVNSAPVPPSPAPSSSTSSTSSSSSSSSTSPPGYGHHGPLRSDSPVYEDLDTFHASLISTVSAPGYTASPPAAGSFSQPPPPPMYGQQLHLKEEPQTVPEMPGDTPPLSPINMESQERIKAERKRMRNRIAASKCRKRKLERISRLEDKVKNLKNQNSELSSTANGLREQVALLKQKVMNHVNSGCQLMLTQQLQTF